MWKILSRVPKFDGEKPREDEIQKKRLESRSLAVLFVASSLTYDQDRSQSELDKFITKHLSCLLDAVGLILARECQKRGHVDFFRID